MRIRNPMCGRKNTLYHDLHDTEVTVLEMIRQGMHRLRIQQAIQDLGEEGTLDEEKRTSLMELVQSLSGGLLDTEKSRSQQMHSLSRRPPRTQQHT